MAKKIVETTELRGKEDEGLVTTLSFDGEVSMPEGRFEQATVVTTRTGELFETRIFGVDKAIWTSGRYENYQDPLAGTSTIWKRHFDTVRYLRNKYFHG